MHMELAKAFYTEVSCTVTQNFRRNVLTIGNYRICRRISQLLLQKVFWYTLPCPHYLSQNNKAFNSLNPHSKCFDWVGLDKIITIIPTTVQNIAGATPYIFWTPPSSANDGWAGSRSSKEKFRRKNTLETVDGGVLVLAKNNQQDGLYWKKKWEGYT